MVCEHCGTALNCPHCSANEVQRLGAKIDELKFQTRRTIIKLAITVPISITIVIKFFLSDDLIKEIKRILGTFLFFPPTPSPNSPLSGDFTNPCDSLHAHTKNFIIEESVKEVLLRVDIYCEDGVSCPATILLLDEYNYERYSNRGSYNWIHKADEAVFFVYDGSLRRGRYYIVCCNSINQGSLFDIKISLAPGSLR